MFNYGVVGWSGGGCKRCWLVGSSKNIEDREKVKRKKKKKEKKDYCLFCSWKKGDVIIVWMYLFCEIWVCYCILYCIVLYCWK